MKHLLAVVLLQLRCPRARRPIPRRRPGPASTVTIDSPMAAPKWAQMERQLLAENVPAAREFFQKYFDDRGYLLCFVRWGANDGPDDAFENFNHWPELHALGASDEIVQMYLKGHEGMIKQYTEGQDDESRARRRRRDVLQGVQRALRLAAPRRRAAAVQPDGAVGADRSEISRARAAVLRASTWAKTLRRPTTIRSTTSSAA